VNCGTNIRSRALAEPELVGDSDSALHRNI
jgi:hypothetical protein